jgi:hypothetical protein
MSNLKYFKYKTWPSIPVVEEIATTPGIINLHEGFLILGMILPHDLRVHDPT